jgi:hypothetical protein
VWALFKNLGPGTTECGAARVQRSSEISMGVSALGALPSKTATDANSLTVPMWRSRSLALLASNEAGRVAW